MSSPDGEAEASAMTAKPVRNPWTALPYDSDWECARVVDPLHGICNVFGEPEIATARAKLFAAAPETAAEHDRLKVVILELMDAVRAAGVRLAHHMMEEEKISGEPHALDVVVMNQINAAVKSAITGIDSSIAEARE